METVQSPTDPYGTTLIHPLPVGPGVCATCRAATADRNTWCRACHQAAESAPANIADAVVPVSIAVRHERFATDLWRYKELRDGEEKHVAQRRLAAVLWRFLEAHERCVAAAADAESFGLVTTVPSTGGRRQHPFARIVGDLVDVTRDRYAELLIADPAVPADRDVHQNRYLALDGQHAAAVAGADVLLLDDTWTRGGRAQSAAVALKKAGAARVAIVVLGRHFDPGYPANADYLAQARSRPFSWDKCCVHPTGLW
jgi:predicted amidophosphoribosyltransferase